MKNKRLVDLKPFSKPVCLGADESLEDVTKAVMDHPETHDLCILDDEGHLMGVINIKKLFRTIFSYHIDPKLMTRDLIEMVTTEAARDVMVEHPVVALEEEEIDEAIGKMMTYDLGEIPVVDGENKLVGKITMALLLRVWLQEREKG